MPHVTEIRRIDSEKKLGNKRTIRTDTTFRYAMIQFCVLLKINA